MLLVSLFDLARGDIEFYIFFAELFGPADLFPLSVIYFYVVLRFQLIDPQTVGFFQLFAAQNLNDGLVDITGIFA